MYRRSGHDLVVDGDRVAARLTDTGTPVGEWNGLAPTGATVSIAETAFYRVEDGRFKDLWYLLDADGLGSSWPADPFAIAGR